MLTDRILVIDDDPSWRELLCETLEGLVEPYTVHAASSYTEAAMLLDRRHYHMAFVDLRLREDARELEGKKLVQQIVEQDNGTSVVIATAHADVNTAIIALKQWRVLDFVLKDAWDPGKVAELVAKGVLAARQYYRARYESAVDVLRGERDILPWLAETLAAIAPTTQIERPDRLLSDFLNSLLAGLYPLLPQRCPEPGSALPDVDNGTATARFWSKALGLPIVVRYGQAAAVDCPGTDEATCFARVERRVANDTLGIVGIVYAPDVPDFTAYQSA